MAVPLNRSVEGNRDLELTQVPVCSIEANILRQSREPGSSGSPPAVRADINMFEGQMAEDSTFKNHHVNVSIVN